MNNSSRKSLLSFLNERTRCHELKDAQELEFGNFTSSKTLLQKLIDNGVHLYACPACLEAADKKPEDLMDGVKIAEKQAFFDFTQGRILNFSY